MQLSDNEKDEQLYQVLKRAGATDEDDLRSVAKKLRPHIEPETVLQINERGRLEVDITTSIDGSFISALVVGNMHCGAYSWPDGKMNGMNRIGHCDHAVSRLLPNSQVADISNVRFMENIGLNQPVRVSLNLKKEVDIPSGKLSILDTQGTILGTNRPAFVPSTVTAFQPAEAL